MTAETMQITMMPIASIKPYDRNPRNNKDAVSIVAKSIREFGFRQPIVVDADHVIIVGHTRYLAAIELEMTEVPVHVADGLSADQIKAYRIADNKTGEASSWDMELLPLEIADLQKADYDIQFTGFSIAELNEATANDVTGGLTDPDLIPEPPDEAKTKRGDVYLLGRWVWCPQCQKKHWID